MVASVADSSVRKITAVEKKRGKFLHIVQQQLSAIETSLQSHIHNLFAVWLHRYPALTAAGKDFCFGDWRHLWVLWDGGGAQNKRSNTDM